MFGLNKSKVDNDKDTVVAEKDNKLLQLIRKRDWDATIQRLEKKKSKDFVTGDQSSLLLHAALKGKAPLHVVKKIHEARPEAVSDTTATTHEMMALHVACEEGLPLDVVEYLHKQWPDAASEQATGAMMPLHLACVSNACRVPVICYLLSAFPQAMEKKDERGSTPLDYVEHSGHPHQQIIAREFERGHAFWSAKDLYDANGNPLSLLICQRKWDEVMERIHMYPEEALVWTVYKKKRNLPIHYACRYKAPLKVIAELAELHPYGLDLTCQEDDMTALHLSCQHGGKVDVVEALVKAHKGAASHQDDLGLLPLHLACANITSAEKIKALVRAYPEGVFVKCKRGYTPLVYAEVTTTPHTKKVIQMLKDAEDHVKELDSIQVTQASSKEIECAVPVSSPPVGVCK